MIYEKLNYFHKLLIFLFIAVIIAWQETSLILISIWFAVIARLATHDAFDLKRNFHRIFEFSKITWAEINNNFLQVC